MVCAGPGCVCVAVSNFAEGTLSWRQSCDVTVIWSFQTGLETTTCGVRVSFRRPFAPNSFIASMLPLTSWVGGAQTLSPGGGNPRYATACTYDQNQKSFSTNPSTSLLVFLAQNCLPLLSLAWCLQHTTQRTNFQCLRQKLISSLASRKSY